MLRTLSFSLLALASAAFSATTPPSVQWIAAGGGAKNDKTRAICFDQQGNVFLAGEMTGDGKFGDIEAKSAGGMDFMLAKVDPQGKFLWVRTLGGQLTDRGYGVVADTAGNTFVTGHFQSTDARVGGKALPNAGDYDIFVAKYDPQGNQLWVRTAGGKGYDYGHGIAIDGAGDIVVTGSIAGEAAFGGIKIGEGNGREIFCAKYTAAGDLKWVKVTTGKASGSGHGVAVDGSNNIYIGGNVSGEGAFGSQPIKTSGAMVVKLNAKGDAQWVTTTENGLCHEITADAQGRVWIAGMFKTKATVGGQTYTSPTDKDSDGFIAHLTSDGIIQWSRVTSSPGIDYCLGVATDGAGTCFACGEFNQTATFGGQSLTSRGMADIQLGAFDEKGNLEWLTQFGGEKNDNAYTMVYRDGALAIGGACQAPATFGASTLGVSQGADAYGVKVRVR